MKGYGIRVHLEDLPDIWRRILIPAGITFARLHDVLQRAMGWNDTHLYEFGVEGETLRFTNSEETVDEYEYYRQKQQEGEIDPKDAWVERVLGNPWKLASKAKIDKYLCAQGTLQYIYDFGDYWRHIVELEEDVEEPQLVHAVCLGGAGACPPDDVGGVPGYLSFIEAWNNEGSPEHEDMVRWGRSMGFTGEFSVDQVNESLARVRLKKPRT